MTGRGASWTAAIAVTIAALCATADMFALSPSASELRAAFVFNFVRFATWPADALPPDGAIVVCVLDRDDVADAFLRLTRSGTIDGRKVQARRVAWGDDVRSCHALYTSVAEPKRMSGLIEGLKDAPVLTIADSGRPRTDGAVASFFVERDQLRFAVDVAAMYRARLILSSKLLTLATIAGR
jgi:hypothetical protein